MGVWAQALEYAAAVFRLSYDELQSAVLRAPPGQGQLQERGSLFANRNPALYRSIGGCTRVYAEKQSGTRTDRKELDRALQELKPGISSAWCGWRDQPGADLKIRFSLTGRLPSTVRVMVDFGL